MRKISLKFLFTLLALGTVTIAYAQKDQARPKTIGSKNIAYGKNCSSNTPYKGYVTSVAVGYGGANKSDTKNWISITLVDKNGKNPEWYWTKDDADTDAGKALLSTAQYAASSGQKIYAECTPGGGGDHDDIKSLWVGPDAPSP
ncbi:hypothetical protein [Xenorhabdus sp. SGI240]|uniref:hypothetical protein n=1 Tax=Xenorhabdus sp. SGI240 TaxID=3158262 RepID=UPI0032B74E6E